jgi:nucleoside-triphosphatase
LHKRILILTSNPGVGKTTVLIKTVDALNAEGISVGGMISREAREGNARVGFEIVDLTNNKNGWLANINQRTGPQVGKYGINLEDLDSIGAKGIVDAVEKKDVIVVDEIGPMELFSQNFKQSVAKALDSQKLVLCVVHLKANDPLITRAKHREEGEVFMVTLANRDNLPGKLKQKALDFVNDQ